jgi:predicted metal-binding protein
VFPLELQAPQFDSEEVKAKHVFLKETKSMAKRRGNPNWGKPEPIGPVVPTVTSFEQIVKEFKLSPDQYIRSTRLREWARRNKNSKYIPEALLEAWGFEIESTL